MSAIKTLVTNIVDYAGLFPPAALPMQTVVDNYHDYLNSPQQWMLSRLIVPTARLEEFLAAANLPTTADASPWRISALVPSADEGSESLEAAIETINRFNATHREPEKGLAVIDAVELKAPTLGHVARTVAAIPKNINAFLEVPHQDDPAELIAAISKAPENIFAKIRTGGVTQDLIPPVEQVARFIGRCAEHKIGFKATAGLHHPMRGDYRLTYEKDADLGTMYGFLNVFVAACLAMSGIDDQKVIESVLVEADSAAFQFDDSQLTWNGHSIQSAQLQDARQKFAISFGSCSFEEPTGELGSLQKGLCSA